MTHIPTVLIVEDDPVFRRVLSFTVSDFGLRVETAAHGQLGFERLVQGGIDFLVTDLQMPICTGLRLIEMLDESDLVERPPTILCTAKGLELDTVDLMRRKQLVAIVHKPFSPRKLGDLILQELQLPALAVPSYSAQSYTSIDLTSSPLDESQIPDWGLSTRASSDG